MNPACNSQARRQQMPAQRPSNIVRPVPLQGFNSPPQGRVGVVPPGMQSGASCVGCFPLIDTLFKACTTYEAEIFALNIQLSVPDQAVNSLLQTNEALRRDLRTFNWVEDQNNSMNQNAPRNPSNLPNATTSSRHPHTP